MEKINRNPGRIMFAALFIVCNSAMLLGGIVKANAAPVLSIEKEIYDFGAILEGTTVTHDFTIENKGNEPLLIPRVRSNCACAVADYSEKIMPGEKGKVTIEYDSKGSGGETVNYKVRGDSNDPDRENFDLTITGHVDPILIIEPEKIVLSGNAGEDLETEIFITHDKRHPLKIISAESKKGNVSVTIEEIAGSEQKKYRLRLSSLMKEQGTYNDYVYLKTNSDVFPDKQLRVKIDIR